MNFEFVFLEFWSLGFRNKGFGLLFLSLTIEFCNFGFWDFGFLFLSLGFIVWSFGIGILVFGISSLGFGLGFGVWRFRHKIPS